MAKKYYKVGRKIYNVDEAVEQKPQNATKGAKPKVKDNPGSELGSGMFSYQNGVDMLKKINEGYDVVIASRYCNNSDVVGVAKHRLFMSDMAGVYYRFMLNVPNVKDYTCGYRIYTNEIINKLVRDFGEEPIKEKSFACMMELLYKLYLSGAKFSEVGFQLRYDNKKGESKMKVLKTMSNSLRVGWYLRRKGKKLINNEKIDK